MSVLSDNIIKTRRDAGLSLRKLGESIDLSAQYLCDIEQDRRYPPYHTVLKIAHALKVSVFDLDPDIMVSIPLRVALEHGIQVEI